MLASRLTFPASSAPTSKSGAILPKEERHLNYCSRKGRNGAAASMQKKVCKYWMEGRCTRRSCAYLHPPIMRRQQKSKAQTTANTYLNKGMPPSSTKHKTWHRQVEDRPALASMPLQKKTWHATPPAPMRHSTSVQDVPHDVGVSTPTLTHSSSTGLQNSDVPHSWADDLHVSKRCNTEEHTHGAAARMIAALSGHDAAVTGLVFPRSSQMLFSVGEDATLRAWDCGSGLCSETLHLAHPPSCLFQSFSDPHWLFVGLPDEVRVCNISTHSQQTLAASSPVLSLSSSGNLLAAGLQDGSILVWRFETSSGSFHPFRCLLAPTGTETSNHKTGSPVSCLEPCLAPGSSIIYAGSLDGMIRLWDLASGACLQAFCAHSKAITQLLYCDTTCLVSASQDGAIKLWKVSSGAPGYQLSLQSTFLPGAAAGDHGVEDGLSCPQPLAMCGIFDEADTPILFAAYSDHKVRIMEVPSFRCKGTIGSEGPIQAMYIGPCQLLFLGSSTGKISVWEWK